MIDIADLINGTFELIGGCFLWTNVRKLYNDKVLKGINIMPVAFFTSWGYWNLYYYPSLDQWFSFVGGVNIVIANSVWVGQAIYYTYWYKRNETTV